MPLPLPHNSLWTVFHNQQYINLDHCPNPLAAVAGASTAVGLELCGGDDDPVEGVLVDACGAVCSRDVESAKCQGERKITGVR